MNRTAMSYGSAVEAVARWICEHDGMTPRADQCRKENALPHRVTLQYVCGGVTNAVSAALQALGYIHRQSGTSMSLLSVCLSGAGSAGMRMVMCLRCDRTIPYDPIARLCTRCRWDLRTHHGRAGCQGEMA